MAFDCISKWVEEGPVKGDRYLWTFNTKTKEILWKNRKVYSYWSGGETGRLQTIFEEMTKQLPMFTLQAANKDEFDKLVKLRGRVTACYEGYYRAHGSFFGFFYRLLFAFFLSDHYDELKRKLDGFINSSLSKIDISSFPAKEIESIARILSNESYGSMDIQWDKLSFDQFKAAFRLEKLARKKIQLEDLDKEKTTYLFEQDKKRINQLYNSDIEKHLANIEPRFLKNYTSLSSLNLAKLNSELLVEVLKNSPYLYEHQLKGIDLSPIKN